MVPPKLRSENSDDEAQVAEDVPTPKDYTAPLLIPGISGAPIQNHADTEHHKFHSHDADFAAGKDSALGLAGLVGTVPVFAIDDEDGPLRAIEEEVKKAVSAETRWAGFDEDRHGSAEVHLDNVRYVLHERAKVGPIEGNDGQGVERERDTGHSVTDVDGKTVGMQLDDFWRQPQARVAELKKAEVAALRLYTTSTFRLINGPLRKADPSSTKTDQLALPITTHFIDTGLKKLRACHMKVEVDERGRTIPFKPRHLWRGLKNKKYADTFFRLGGTELACMSTTEDIEVVARYAKSESPLIFRIKVDTPMDMGADISWLSTFPDEKEILYPPLTCAFVPTTMH